jgi:PAS domain S-box-containing protein
MLNLSVNRDNDVKGSRPSDDTFAGTREIRVDSMTNTKILVVEDEYITAADLIAILEQMGFSVPASTDTGEEVYALACLHSPDLILMDINLKGGMTGIEAAGIVRSKLNIPVIFLTGQSDEATIDLAIGSEPLGYIIKPFEERALKTAITMALYKHRIDRQLRVHEERYRQVAESSDNLIAILNFDGTIDYINQTGGVILDRTPENLCGLTLSEVLKSPVFHEIEQYLRSFPVSAGKWVERMKISVNEKDLWLHSTMVPLMESRSGIRQILWTAREITEWIELEKTMQKEGLIQLEKNMEQFQILNDEIRNPLTLIVTFASMDECKSLDEILKAVKKIDDLVTQLDKGWVESNKVRSFLLRNYRHGEEFLAMTDLPDD